jgi:hypothetical protein
MSYNRCHPRWMVELWWLYDSFAIAPSSLRISEISFFVDKSNLTRVGWHGVA